MLLASTVFLAAITWPASPAPADLKAGADLARGVKRIGLSLSGLTQRQQATARDIFGADAKPIGFWSNGWSQQPVEHATWMNPRMAARWIGWLDARERWTGDEIQERWDAAKARLEGRMAFLIELAAFPKSRAWDVGDPADAVTSDLEPRRIVLESNGERLQMTVTLLGRWEGRDQAALSGFDWWRPAGLQAAFGYGESPQAPLPVGGHHRSWLLAECMLPPWLGKEFRLQIISTRKVRTAIFRTDPAKR